jgi:hypothetical protein
MDKKIAVIIFHANVWKIYKEEWIAECLDSLKKQTMQQYSVVDLNYGQDIDYKWDYQAIPFYHFPMPNHVFAENIAIDIAYNAGYDYFFIVNLDDVYYPERIEKQVAKLNEGYDLVSTDFIRTHEDGRPTILLKMSALDFDKEAKRGHNIICHSGVCFNRRFWEKCRYLDVNGIPTEDFTMWKKAHSLGLKFCVIDEVLMQHRVHGNNVSGNKINKMEII